jgi:hypothetical protein
VHTQAEHDALLRIPADMHAHTVPVRVEQAVRREERAESRARGAREQLDERRQVLRAHVLRGQRSMSQVIVRAFRIRQCAREEGVRGRGCAPGIHRGERGAKEPGERMAEAGPAVVDPARTVRDPE